MNWISLKSVLRRVPLLPRVYSWKHAAWDYAAYMRDYREFGHLIRSQSIHRDRFPLSWQNRFMRLGEGRLTTDFDPHYTYHVGWAMRALACLRPSEHVDVSSSFVFSVALSAFLPVRFYEFRPVPVWLEGLQTLTGNLMALPLESSSVSSLSCMHVVEHIGLGRYGDPLDPQGDLKAIAELKRVLAPGGHLLFVTPTGRSRLCFNAHRIYSYEQVTGYFAPLVLEEFSLLPDDYSAGMIAGATAAQADAQVYGCGCYLFRKPVAPVGAP